MAAARTAVIERLRPRGWLCSASATSSPTMPPAILTRRIAADYITIVISGNITHINQRYDRMSCII